MGSYSFDQLGTYISGIRDAAIESTMSWLGFHGTVHTGFEGMGPSMNALRISPLGGSYVGSTFVAGGQVTDLTNGGPGIFHVPPGWGFDDLPGMVNYYNNRLDDMFSDWWGMPFEGDFDDTISLAQSATQELALRPQGDPGGSSSIGASPAMTRLNYITDKIGQFEGSAIDTFNRDYASRLPDLIPSQQDVVKVLWVGAAGQKLMWQRTRDAVADTAGRGLEAMKAADGGGVDIAGALKILGAAASLATIIITDGAAAPVVGAVSTVIGVVSGFVPETEESDAPIKGDNPIAVLDSMDTVLSQINDQVKAEERGQAAVFEATSRLLTDQRASFDIAAPPINTDTDASDFKTADDTALEFGILHQIAQSDLPDVAEGIGRAGSKIGQANTPSPWTRPGRLGIGDTGPYPTWKTLNTDIAGVLANTSAELQHAAEVLEIVTRDFEATEAQVHAGLQAQLDKVNQSPGA